MAQRVTYCRCDAVAFVLVGHPGMHLLLSDESAACRSLVWPGLSGGSRMVLISSTDNVRKLLQTSSSKAESSSPTPLIPCFLMKAGSYLRSKSCKIQGLLHMAASG